MASALPRPSGTRISGGCCQTRKVASLSDRIHLWVDIAISFSTPMAFGWIGIRIGRTHMSCRVDCKRCCVVCQKLLPSIFERAAGIHAGEVLLPKPCPGCSSLHLESLLEKPYPRSSARCHGTGPVWSSRCYPRHSHEFCTIVALRMDGYTVQCFLMSKKGLTSCIINH